MSKWYNKYWFSKTTKVEPNHKKLSLKKPTVCVRNGRKNHEFREYIFNPHKWDREWCKKYNFPKVVTKEDERNPQIIKLWHEAEVREAKDEARGTSWWRGYMEKNGVSRHYECVHCGKQAYDHQNNSSRKIQNNLWKIS